MRTVELAKIATAAEALRLRRLARRQAMRGAYGAAAAAFAIAVLVVLHFTIYVALTLWLSPMVSVLIVLAIDVIAAGVLGTMALRSVPDPIEVEARQVRVQAMLELKRSLTVMGMAAEVTGLVFRTGVRTRARRSVATAAAEMVSRLIGR